MADQPDAEAVPINVHVPVGAETLAILGTTIERLATDRRAAETEVERLRAKLRAEVERLLALLADGRTYDQIAAELYLARHTVKSHALNIARRLDTHSAAAAVAVALRAGIIA